MAPKPNISAMWPSVLPIPFSIVSIILVNGIPSINAVIIDVIINEINVFNLNPMINTNKITIPKTTLINGHISLNMTFPSFSFQ